MAISCLPTYPLVLFGIIEPILLTWGYIVGLQNPQKFFLDQVPNSSSSSSSSEAVIPPQGLVLTLALINVYLLLAALAVVCCFTPHARVARGFLLAVALADYGHIYATYAGVGPDVFWDPLGGRWNDMVWGAVGASVFLNANRWLTLLGVFGRLGGSGSAGSGGSGSAGSAGSAGSEKEAKKGRKKTA